ncbi:zinc finger protein 697-like isoform X2 [Varroa destructor]|uniref:C2H2-type domain-containing protein n=1 Tax=Varroa destructor TaxID=109461 RepID=A0A7M7KMT2_VARDE|nr:zinc finger protein 697-like isoform X2 [Varroa destructor]
METLSAEAFIRRAAARSMLCRVANLKLSSTPSAFPGYQCSLTKLFLKKRPHSMPAIGHLLAASSYLAKVNCSLRSGAAGGTKTRGIYANYSQQTGNNKTYVWAMQLPGGRDSPGENDEDSDQPTDENCPNLNEQDLVVQSSQHDRSRSEESVVDPSTAGPPADTADQDRPPEVGDQGKQFGLDQLDGVANDVDQIDNNDDDDLSSVARDDCDDPEDEDVDQDPEPDTDYPEHREFDRNCCCHRCTDNFIARLFRPDIDQDAENEGARCRSDQAGCPNSILSRPPSRASSPCGSAGNVGPLVAHPRQQGGLPLSLAMPLSTSPLGHSLANIQATTVTTPSGPQKQFLCPMCNKYFTQKGNLKTHMMIHTGEKPYSCHVCGRSFTQKGNVDTHMKIHTGEKVPYISLDNPLSRPHSGARTGKKSGSDLLDYGCDSCGKRFARKGNLKTHVRSVHTKEKPFACGVCGKCFSQKGNMQTHLRTHNKDDRFPCLLCGKTFSQKGNLKTHMQRHAGQAPSSPHLLRRRSKGGSSALHQPSQHLSVRSSVGSGGLFAREPLGVLGELGDGANELGPLALSLPPLNASATGSPSGMVDFRAANDDQFSAALASDDSESSSESESESPRSLPVFPGSNKLPLGLPPVFPDSGQPPTHTSWLNPRRSQGPPHGPAVDQTVPPHGEFPRDGDGAQLRRLSSLLSGMLPMRHTE